MTDEINRDDNRASIIIWSLAQRDAGGPGAHPIFHAARRQGARTGFNPAVERGDGKAFQTRPTHFNIVQDPLADFVDVVSFNEYIGWYDGLPEKCGRVSWEIPYDKPVFISEFGGDAKQGLHGDKTQRWTRGISGGSLSSNAADAGQN